jgi:hypothetical protein
MRQVAEQMHNPTGPNPWLITTDGGPWGWVYGTTRRAPLPSREIAVLEQLAATTRTPGADA